MLSLLILLCPRDGSEGAWQAYSSAKDAISRVCGWDAPRHAYDQDQYDLAIARYVREVGL